MTNPPVGQLGELAWPGEGEGAASSATINPLGGIINKAIAVMRCGLRSRLGGRHIVNGGEQNTELRGSKTHAFLGARWNGVSRNGSLTNFEFHWIRIASGRRDLDIATHPTEHCPAESRCFLLVGIARACPVQVKAKDSKDSEMNSEETSFDLSSYAVTLLLKYLRKAIFTVHSILLPLLATR